MALVALPLAAQTPRKATLNEALLAARTPIVLNDGKFSGAGADVLTQALAQSKFVLLGEDHLTREIPEFASALFDAMHPDLMLSKRGRMLRGSWTACSNAPTGLPAWLREATRMRMEAADCVAAYAEFEDSVSVPAGAR